ncbi:hypothetical protein QBC46DRAFT_348323 [Diplogelasinospora grovesii]|uniref:Uncharacterized protein n=1 Tax=Diplogelasinospora grovesii TaxID=303347 RepID=A0AAN6MUU2_9PEZI|nr:hypothetical protein QBC46DRAFT_348323 [Diplogelasinospora grovesii]
MSLLVANNSPATAARPGGQLPDIEASAVQDGFSDYLFAEEADAYRSLRALA